MSRDASASKNHLHVRWGLAWANFILVHTSNASGFICYQCLALVKLETRMWHRCWMSHRPNSNVNTGGAAEILQHKWKWVVTVYRKETSWQSFPNPAKRWRWIWLPRLSFCRICKHLCVCDPWIHCLVSTIPLFSYLLLLLTPVESAVL